MLEAMRVIVMERLNTMRCISEKWVADICPNIQKRLELNKDKHRFWHVIAAGGNVFEVRNGSEAFKVDEENRTCTCRMWQLIGIPCPHSIAVMFKINKCPETYVPACFRKESYTKAYNQYMTPLGGMNFWPDSSMFSTVLAPKPRAMPGRPRKKRIRAAHERQLGNRVSRVGVAMTCQNCFETGHNSLTCKKEKVMPTKTTKRGRPRKVNGPKSNVGSSNTQETTQVAENEDTFVHVRVDTPSESLGIGRGVGIGRGRGRPRGGHTDAFGHANSSPNMDGGIVSEGMPTGRGRARGRARGRGRASGTLGVRYGILAAWFGVGADSQDPNNVQDVPATQESQAGSNQGVRPRSARISQRMSKAMESATSSGNKDFV